MLKRMTVACALVVLQGGWLIAGEIGFNEDFSLAETGMSHTQQHSDDGCLARSIAPQQPANRTLGDLKIEPIDCAMGPVVLRQTMRHDHVRHG